MVHKTRPPLALIYTSTPVIPLMCLIQFQPHTHTAFSISSPTYYEHRTSGV